MATNVLRPKGAGCSLRARSLTSWATGQVVRPRRSHKQLCLSFSSIPHLRKPFPTRFTFVLRFNLVQVYEATVDST